MYLRRFLFALNLVFWATLLLDIPVVNSEAVPYSSRSDGINNNSLFRLNQGLVLSNVQSIFSQGYLLYYQLPIRKRNLNIPNISAPTTYTSSGTDQIENQWALKQIHAAEAQGITRGNGNVIVAVIDTGVDSTHPFLAGRTVSGRAFCPFPLGESDNTLPQDEWWDAKQYGHGTMVAGLVLATAPNIKIMPVKVVCGLLGGTVENLANGIRYAADHGAKIINISLAVILHEMLKHF